MQDKTLKNKKDAGRYSMKGSKWWGIFIFGGEWWRLSFFDGEMLGKSGFFREKNIKKIGILGLFFCGGYITMWLIVAQSG